MPIEINLNALVLSTTPPLPRDYGNRNRVFQLVEFLKGLGYKLTFVFYPFDEDWQKAIPSYYKELCDYFEYFCVVPNTRGLHRRAAGEHHEIDEWWDDNIGVTLEWLFKRKRFDLFVVNYTFLSRAFQFAPKGISKVLDTHDSFSSRKETFEANGVQPEFFYTTPDRERVAFDRSHLVIAIKESEAKAMAQNTSAEVIAIPYWDLTPPPVKHLERPKPVRFDHLRPLRVGFIGAHNAVNVVNIKRFLTKFQRWVRLYNAPVRVVVAGNVCRGIDSDFAFLDKLGRVERIEDFYDNVDAIVAPLEFSTGIKIKVGEALAWDKPVVGTENAFDGYRVWHPTQSLPSVDAVCDALIGVSMNETQWDELVLDARRAARSARSAQEHGFKALKSWLRTRSRSIILVTSRPFWRRNTLVDEYIAHIAEYLSYLGNVMILTTATGPADMSRLFAKVDLIHVEEPQIPVAVQKLNNVSTIAAVVLDPFVLKDIELAVPSETRVWRLELGCRTGATNASSAHMVGIANAPTFPVSVLRYPPMSGIKALDDASVQILVAEPAGEWEEAIVDYALAAASANDLKAEVARLSSEFETSPQAFAAIAQRPARRVILIGRVDWFEYVAQVARYRHQSCMIVSRRLIAPSALDADGESVTDALDRFLQSHVSVNAPAGPDSGWSKVWKMLDEANKTAAPA